MNRVGRFSELGNNGRFYHPIYFVRDANPTLGAICTALRDIISELHKERIEIVWKKQNIASYGISPKKMSKHYTYIGLHKNHVQAAIASDNR